MAYNNETIVKPHIILCEGLDAQNFLISYQEHLEAKSKIFAEFQVFRFDGNENLKSLLDTIRSISGYDTIARTVIIVRDSEKDFTAAINSIKSSLKSVFLECPNNPCELLVQKDKNVAFSLFPTLSTALRNGTLEDLCLELLAESNVEIVTNSIDEFLDTQQNKCNRAFPRIHKTKLHTYFSITDKFVSMKIGEAARAKAFNFDSDKLSEFKSLLESIAVH